MKKASLKDRLLTTLLKGGGLAILHYLFQFGYKDSMSWKASLLFGLTLGIILAIFEPIDTQKVKTKD